MRQFISFLYKKKKFKRVMFNMSFSILLFALLLTKCLTMLQLFTVVAIIGHELE